MSLKRQRSDESGANDSVAFRTEVERNRVAILSSTEAPLMSTEEKVKFDAEVAKVASLMPHCAALVKSSSASRGVLANPRSPVGPDLAKALEIVGRYECEVASLNYYLSLA